MKRYLPNTNVFEQALTRMRHHFVNGDHVVSSFSAGKDSTCCLNICLMLAEETGNLPLDVVMRDEEIMFPGTYEYAERVAADPRVRFHWYVAHQPITNVFNRTEPYWWVFDPQLRPDQWMRPYPRYGIETPFKAIGYICRERAPHEPVGTPGTFEIAPGKNLISVMGLRASESGPRAKAMASTLGYLAGDNRPDCIQWARPIYDWQTRDVWRAIRENGWDYNHAYDAMFRYNLPEHFMRIAPPTLNQASVGSLKFAQQTWPQWFDKLAERLPGVRTAAQFGMASVQPLRKGGETWQDVFMRECINEAPADWIRHRAQLFMDYNLVRHASHANTPFPDMSKCMKCGTIGSWESMAHALWNGDPFSLKAKGVLDYLEPEFFRAGAGTWQPADLQIEGRARFAGML